MDLSFLRSGGLTPATNKVPGWPRAPVWPFLRAATAAAQAASPTAQAVAGVLRGQDGEDDWVQELAELFAPRSDGMIEAVRLAGSFNPLIARRLAGGQGR
ncbi:MAG TPA: hypothetical protein DCG90_08415 [Sphingobium sp.]|jgi:hypothetical protein|uniref:hypothetical protein n=1 Tax=unclassified Sphingobium TaxID=2611147 RepID=UPI0007F4EF86|nr:MULTISPECIES: hypothetical protein [unclassified Sphingobium]OAN54951.1 hypothetical protein A7Q26_22640 [Sphingobium sp. TCM1]WIW87884.1 hypothetical protein K3M67_13075 [Sphingobium sp. V4]HAF41774.1 hypothetical protein [Sphingobium sp.]